MKAGMLEELCGGWERDTQLNMLKEMRRTYGKEYVVKKKLANKFERDKKR